MSRRTLLAQLFPAYLLASILLVIIMTWFVTTSCRNVFLQQRERDLRQLAQTVARSIPAREFMEIGNEQLSARCSLLSPSASATISLYTPEGRLVCERGATGSGEGLSETEVPVDVRSALNGIATTNFWKDEEVTPALLAASAPVLFQDSVLGAVRVAEPLSTVEVAIARIRTQVLTAGCCLIALTSIVAWLLARHVTRPLAEMRSGLREFAQGKFEYRLPIANSLELADLGEALNDMASKLDERIGTIIQQRNEQEAVLASMGEGVIAIDRDERILRMNQSAADIFGVNATETVGKDVQEVVRNRHFVQFIRDLLERNRPIASDMTFRLDRELYFRLHGSVLRDGDGQSMGVVVVLDDLTNVRRLEGLRRDFVANVSHELRTPITNIKGFVETLLDGALESPNDARRFIEIIGRHAERLREIIDNLMKLARMEQDPERRDLDRANVSVAKIFGTVNDLLKESAASKNLQLVFQDTPSMTMRVNLPLVEQAVLNLVDNAIKYTEPNRSVWISARQTEEDWFITVQDEGVGIPKVHLLRIFERFYRVDKGRSRQEGGTGLGLAIVKHVALAHGGEVLVESTVGKGSVFTLRIPRPKRDLHLVHDRQVTSVNRG